MRKKRKKTKTCRRFPFQDDPRAPRVPRAPRAPRARRAPNAPKPGLRPFV